MVLHQDLISGLGGVHRGVGVSEGGLDQLGNCRQLCYLVGVTTHGRASLGFFRRLRVSPAAAINWILSRALIFTQVGLGIAGVASPAWGLLPFSSLFSLYASSSLFFAPTTSPPSCLLLMCSNEHPFQTLAFRYLQ